MSSKYFHKVKVKDISKTTEDCSVITLDIPEEIREQFKFKAGQYLTLEANIDGEEVRRSYSLCSSPLDNEWQVGIKKIVDGKFSTYANDVLAVGDELSVMAPNGHFHVDIDQDAERNYVAFAAGSGITPVISIIKTQLSAEPKSSFKLFYVNKTVGSIIMKEELESLKNQFMDRLEIFYFLTKQKRTISFLNGRLDEDKLDVIFENICSIEETDHYFSCGPEPMILMIRDYLKAKGVDDKKIHFELFNTAGSYQQKTENKALKKEGKVAEITIHEGGKSFNFSMIQGSNNILDEALNNNADLPFACKGGVCATCKAKVLEGKVEMAVHYGLEDDELANGYVLTCQCVPVSEKVTVDFDI
jgi:ring-1,2-phenylacetyl-CoA epoxidase subunit PaaE